MNKQLLFLFSVLLLISCTLAADASSSDYSDVPSSDYEDDHILNDVLNYGVDHLFQNAADKYGVSNKTVEVTKINSVQKNDQKDEIYFKFDVEATNNYDASLNGTFTAVYDCEKETIKVLKWKYHIEYEDKPDDNTDDDTDTGNDHCEEEDDGNGDGDDNTDDDGGYTDGEEEEEEEEQDDGGYTDDSDDDYQELDSSQYHSKLIKRLVHQAADYVIAKETKKVPRDNYYIRSLESVYKKHTITADYYKFEIVVYNQKGTTQIKLDVTSEVKNEVGKVLSYSFNITKKN